MIRTWEKKMRFKLHGHAEEVAAKYLAGESTPKIAAFYGVTATSVNRCLRGMGVSRRTMKESHPLKLMCKRGHELSGENVYHTPQGIRACRQCRRVYPAATSNREYRKFWQIRKLYGLTREQYEAKLVSQKNCCAICQREMSKPHIDHDHATKQLRDALCNNCNAAVGYVGESISTAESLVVYLKKWKGSCLL
jgi:hypothetical protein